MCCPIQINKDAMQECESSLYMELIFYKEVCETRLIPEVTNKDQCGGTWQKMSHQGDDCRRPVLNSKTISADSSQRVVRQENKVRWKVKLELLPEKNQIAQKGDTKIKI